ncbi:MAG: SDR family NAD(P)-dependent oxidoreductase [Pirellulaceae bacterium]|nr:SDR family NAD(P)-dependent oxidoreductase [Pirellulaceae bacterium]
MAHRSIPGLRTLLTGASSGIGLALARELAAQGAPLILNARRADRLEQLGDELRRRGGQVFLVPGDITQPEVRRAAIDCARREWDGLDCLINNAGVGASGVFSEAEEPRLRRIMEVNFFAPTELTRLALPLLARGRRPLIVNVGSVLAHRAVPRKSEYCASKFALHGFSDALRAELAPAGIDVLLLCPSTTATEFFDQMLEDRGKLPWRKWGSMSSEAVARRAVRAMRRGRHELILSPGGKLLVWFDRWLPGLVNRLVARWG